MNRCNRGFCPHQAGGQWTRGLDTMEPGSKTTCPEREEMADQPFKDRVLDRLSPLGEVTSRPMFGGHGLYWRETIFGIVLGDRLYFKVNEQSKGEYVAKGMGPFRPNERQTLKSYFEVPPDVLDDTEALLSRAREAIRARQAS